MAGTKFVNPFTPQTPIGAGLQNIAIALFAGQKADQDRASRADMETAHGELYREQARKAAAERELAESLLGARSDDAVTDVAAANAGMPGYTFRAILDAQRGGGDLSRYSPDEVGRARRAWAATAPGYADKTVDPSTIAKALLAHQELADRNAVIAGTADPTKTGQGYFATSGKAPYDNMGGTGTFNLATGAQSLNALGDAKVGSERALAGERTAQASRHGAETKRITDGLFGPAVHMEAEDGGVTPYFLGQVAGTGRAGARPVAPREPGDTVTITEEPISPLVINKSVNDAIVGGVRASLGGPMGDPMIEGAVVSRAQQYYRTPGSPAYGLPEEAARMAVADVLPGGVEDPWFGGIRPKGQAMTVGLPPVPVKGPTTKQKRVQKVSSKPGGAQPAPQPPAAGTPVSHPARPANKTDQQILDEANEAVRQGADRSKVMERLQAWGVPIA